MKKIAIIGAGEFQKPLIVKAKELGYETYVFAWRTGAESESIADHFYPISVVNRDQILHECKKIRPQAVVTIASDIATRTANYVSEQLGLVSNGEKTYCLMTDKKVMRGVLAKAGLPQPDYYVVEDDFSVDALRSISSPYIVKPLDRTNARGISLVSDESKMMEAITKAREYSYVGAAIIESNISGREYSCDTLSFKGEHQIVSFTEVETKDFKPYRLAQPVRFSADVAERYTNMISKALDAFEIKFGASHIEFIVDDDGKPHILEISETTGSDYIGSDLVPLTTGFDYLKAVIDIASGSRPEEISEKLLGSAEMRYIRSEADIEEFYDIRKKEHRSIYQVSTAGKNISVGDSYILFYPTVEMGGFMPLELDRGHDHFKRYDSRSVRKLNSANTALWYALQAYPGKKVYLPDYYYPKMIKEAQAAAGIENVVFYSIGEDLEPANLPETDGVVVLVDYFGTMGRQTAKTAEKYKNVIIDNSFAFFSQPIMRDGVLNIYSCTTFFGVSDGAYLVGENIPEIYLPRDTSAGRSAYLLKALEDGTNSAYSEKNSNDSVVSGEHLLMSEMTMCIMDSIRYDEVAKVRRDNYKYLYDALNQSGVYGEMSSEDAVPQCFPLKGNAKIRSELIARKIYVPQLWKRNLDESADNSVERHIAETLCPLPIDQRYGNREMEYLVQIVRELSLQNK